MKRSILFLTVFAMAGAAGAVGAGTAKAGGSLPWKGQADGVVTEYTTPVNWVIDYVGTATHMGRFTRREYLTLDGAGGVSGTMDWEDVNGDTLRTSFVGGFTGPNDAAGTMTIIGGDGAFAGATGSASFHAHTEDFVHVSISFDGTIDY
jgi:hypothetical protein